jgi:RNA polymerase sigma-70 factor, ECF subfamily
VGGTEATVRLSGIPEMISELDEQREQADHPLFHQALALIQDHFEETTWRAFWGVVIEGRSAQEVGSDLSISAGAVRVAKCRVLQRLRQELGDLPV